MNGAFSLRMLKMKQGLLWGFLICLFFSSTILATNWSAKASLDEYTYYIIKGDGMRPTIELEDLVTVKTNINKSQISAAPQPDGDIIAFHRPKATSLDSSAVILHRCIEIVANNNTGFTYYRTKGDNRENPDNWSNDYRGENYSWNGMVSENLLIGKLVGLSRQYPGDTFDGVNYNVIIYTNSTIADFHYSQSDKKIEFNITGYISYAEGGFCNVTIPKHLLRCGVPNDWQVLFDGNSIEYTLTQNATHTFLYFTHSYSNHNVQIIGTQAGTEFPKAAELGRYVLQDDKYWIVYNKTVQQLRDEGYDVPGDPNWLLQVNYTRLNYTLKCTIVALSWPNVTSQNIEGKYDLNVTAYRIMEDGSIGEKQGSFLKENQPARMGHLWKCHDPGFGLGFNPSALVIGNHFSIGTAGVDLEYSINRTETLTGTPWGHNETYVLYGYFANATHRYDWTIWCDSESGIILKEVAESETPNFKSYEETRTIETVVSSREFEVVKEGKIYKLHVDTNSTLKGFETDIIANKITLTVDGPSGTSGKCNVTVPKKLLAEGQSLEVYIDDQKVNYLVTEDGNNYYICVTYQHSSHTITISFVPFAIWTQWWFWSTIAVGIVILVGAIYVIKKRKPRISSAFPSTAMKHNTSSQHKK